MPVLSVMRAQAFFVPCIGSGCKDVRKKDHLVWNDQSSNNICFSIVGRLIHISLKTIKVDIVKR